MVNKKIYGTNVNRNYLGKQVMNKKMFKLYLNE